MTDGYLWEEASVTYPDWKGTLQLDQSMTQKGIEEVVGLDPDEWMVLGIDIGGGEHDHHLRVIAVSRSIFPEGGDVFPKIAESNGGEIPATEFLIHDVDPYEVLKKITHMLDIRLRPRRIADSGIPVRIVDQGDVPEQDE